MGNCLGSEEAKLEAVKDVGRHGRPQAPARAAHPMAAPEADASMMSSSSGHPSSRSPGSSMNSVATTRSGSTSSSSAAYPEGRILEAPNLRVFTFAELRSATRNFKPDTVLGEGGFGRVYKGWVDEKTMNPTRSGIGMVVAVKKLNHESVQGLQEWQSEVNFLGRLSHPNLVRLLGYCVEDRELLLVYEFMPKGSLENHLFRKGGSFEPLPWNLRLRIAIGAARGLAFLHSSEKQIIYRDFKASNILLDTNYNAKLSDFGLAKNGPTGGDSHVTTRVMGTYGYAAPEYVATGHLYVKSDVWGFGVVLLEMLTGLRALDTGRPAQQHNLVDWAKPYLADRRKLARLVDPRLEGQYPSKAALQAAQLTLRCLEGDPRSRPSMAEVVSALEEIERIKVRPKGGAPRRHEAEPPSGHGHHRSSRPRSGRAGSSHHQSPSMR
ncbi:putative serine/threonine-protein kinase Cx32, chloroplastic [Dichanthelium oligosanthes]|uniref:non-specific serine/threonine protein kinase n=1 Tax=Dichanthelium oligosanthes TaxID=888268 RepID=A0A1E5UUA7_9POAL|nr:putative serine/threonine-protein kinase Cx32, chloroplastic [Dichanthelium oligosanthes]